MRSLFFLIFMLTLPAVLADSLFQFEQVTSEISIEGVAKVKPASRTDDLEYVIINLSFFPQSSFQQQVTQLSLQPQAAVREGTISFEWNRPNLASLEFGAFATVTTSPKIIKVSKKIPFPLQNVPASAAPFLKSSETIDADDPEIVALANELASGKDDLYEVVFTLAKWSKENIEYDLSTLTESVSQSASWVLENRRGVCDELTNLFIAMNRALGIPAKFISGMAYTDTVPTEDGFGAHGWAEIYFPGHGWIPFDVTYGEYGYVDEFHIKLKEAVDAVKPSTRYQWLGRDISLATSALKIKTTIKEKLKKKEDLVELKVIPEKSRVGFGSYNVIRLDIENLQDHYLATDVILSKSDEITLLGESKQAVLLQPGQRKQLYWKAKVQEHLQPGYIYTFPLVASTTRNTSYATTFKVEEDALHLSLPQAERIVQDAAKEEEKTLSRDIAIACTPEESTFYSNAAIEISCSIHNQGNIPMNKLQVCMTTNCKQVDLPISKTVPVDFTFQSSQPGTQEVVFTASNADIFKRTSLEVEVLDAPVITIKDIELPPEVRYDDKFMISFTLEKTSLSKPQDVLMQMLPLPHEWTLDKLQQDRRFSVTLQGKNLKAGKNEIFLKATYHDRLDNVYQTEEQVTIALVEVSVWQRAKLFFLRILT